MIGAIAGDIIGSRFEFNNHRSKDFELFTENSTFTDDTALTIAVARWLLGESSITDAPNANNCRSFAGQLFLANPLIYMMGA